MDNPSHLFTSQQSDTVLEGLTRLALTVNNLPPLDSRQVALLTNPLLDSKFQASRANLSRLLHSLSSSSPSPLTSHTSQEEKEMVRILHAQVLEHSLEKANAALDLAARFRNTPLTDAETKAGATATKSAKLHIKPFGTRLPDHYKPQYACRSHPIDNTSAPFVPPFVKFDFMPPTPSPEPSEDGGAASTSEDSQPIKPRDSAAGEHVDSRAVVEDDSHAPKQVEPEDAKAPVSESVEAGDSELHKGDDSETKKEGDPKRKNKYRKTKKREKVVSLHPFKKEILDSVADNISLEPFSADDVIVHKSLDETPFTFVDTVKELLEVAERFSRCTEISIDLEHHSQRSFLGFTCLIQMSSRLEDVVVDVLKIPSLAVHRALAPIFADSAITKVLHGADNDIEWLERDFGLYIVNMFDTGQAARVLNYPNASLAYLLDFYCQVKADGKKSFQRADWRVRPLPKAMMNYARSDTHYLLYIYDRLRIELYGKDGDEVRHVYEKSGGVALNRFRKPLFIPNRAFSVATKKGLSFNKYQIAVLNNLFKWRDDTARIEDESPQYLAKDPFLFIIVRAYDKARTPGGFLRMLSMKGINNIHSRFLRKYNVEIANIIANTLDSDVPPLPEKKKPKQKSTDSASSGSSSNSSSSSKRGGKKHPNGSTATLPQDSNGTSAAAKKLNPAATVFIPTNGFKGSKPSPRVRGKKASILFESDSGSSNSSEQSNCSHRSSTPVVNEKISLVVNESNFPSLGDSKKGAKNSGSKNKDLREISGTKNSKSNTTVSTSATPTIGLEGAKVATAIVTSAKKSVFDLSESDEDDVVDGQAAVKGNEKCDTIVMKSESKEESTKTECDTVSKVKAGMSKADIGFSELWKNGKEEDDNKNEKKAEAKTNEGSEMKAKEGEESEEIVALSSLRKTRKKKKNRAATGAKKDKTAVDSEVVEPYDFLGEIEKDKNKKKKENGGEKSTKVKSEVFKCMKESKRNRTRRSKKNPASGSRSMTFQAAK